MRRLLAALVLAVPCAAAAAPALESAAAASLSSFAATPLPAPSARLVAATRRPMTATIAGAFSGQTASLALDRRAWTVTGALSGRAVDVAIDNAAGTIKGGANGAAVDLTFVWTPERIAYKGAANQSSVNYAVDWSAGVLDGTANGSPVHIEFSLANGTVNADKSYANGWPVALTYDPVSGRLAGALGGRNVALTLVNADLSDFLQNLYLFLRP